MLVAYSNSSSFCLYKTVVIPEQMLDQIAVSKYSLACLLPGRVCHERVLVASYATMAFNGH